MIRNISKYFITFLFPFFLLLSCDEKPQYSKHEYNIPMRDGKKLFTAVYMPKEGSQKYPILIWRTPYSVHPYGEDKFPKKFGPSPLFVDEGYIFVYQDVRGRFMSEGEFVNMRPYIPNKSDSLTIDETTDTYDTIDWLVKNIPNNNGKVGMWGISYPGFYSSMGLIDAHPALKAVSPQAPIADWFVGDDMHHNGAFTLMLAFNFFANFGQPRPEPTTQWPPRFKHGTPDGYRFFLDMGPLLNANGKYLHNKVDFWNKAMQHGTYDEFWQSRNILPHLKNIKPAVLVVGGWYDGEDLYGTLETYRAIEKNNPGIHNHLVMGPWGHGGWARTDGDWLGNIWFGAKTSHWYQKEIELTFFNYFLKEKGELHLPEAFAFDTGKNRWRQFKTWPPLELQKSALYLHPGERLDFSEPTERGLSYDEYISDPNRPVPFVNRLTTRWGKKFLAEDQRFAWQRPDVLSYESEILSDSLTLAGGLTADLYVSTSGTDCDWVVKLIDVYPDTFRYQQEDKKQLPMGGYQRLVRAEIMRSKFRDSYSEPKPMKPNKITRIRYKLQDIYHTFLPGHKIMIQVQSSWFPLFDRNPQTFTDIYNAQESDFKKAVQRVYHSKQYPSRLIVNLLN